MMMCPWVSRKTSSYLITEAVIGDIRAHKIRTCTSTTIHHNAYEAQREQNSSHLNPPSMSAAYPKSSPLLYTFPPLGGGFQIGVHPPPCIHYLGVGIRTIPTLSEPPIWGCISREILGAHVTAISVLEVIENGANFRPA